MDLKNNVKFEIDIFEAKHYPYQEFIILEGINGVLPELRVMTTSFNDDVDFEDCEVKLIIKDAVKFTAKGFIYKREQIRNQGVRISILLLPKDVIWKQRSSSYDNLDDIISDIWTLAKENIPSGPQMKANQMMMQNHAFLTNALLCLKQDFGFAYELNSNLRGIDMSKWSTDVRVEYESEYEIVSQEIDAHFNPLQDMEVQSTDLTGAGTVVTNVVRYQRSEATTPYHNFAYNRALLNRYNEKLELGYFEYGKVRIGDVVEINLSQTFVQKYRAVFTQIKYVNHELKCITTLKRINE